MNGKRALLVDDNPLARRAVRALLARDPDFEVIGEAQDGFEALAMAGELVPDLILMDINMPRCDGLLTTRLIKRELPYATVVILTVSDDATDLFEAIRSGAQGYLPKSLDPGDWMECLKSLCRGDAMRQDTAHRILVEFASKPAPPGSSLRLTPREREILDLVGNALANREVATTLGVSEQTVKNHIKNMMNKLRLKNRVQLALYARRLIPDPGNRPDP